MGTQCSTYISKITENFRSTHIGYLVVAFSVHGYPEFSTFSRVFKITVLFLPWKTFLHTLYNPIAKRQSKLAHA